MTDKKKNPAVKKAEAKKPKDTAKPAQLLLKDSYNSVVLNGKLVINGKPDGVQFLGHGHRVIAVTENLVIIQRACEDVKEAQKLYKDNGWK